MMQSVPSLLKEHKNTLLKLLPLMAFAVPLLWLYLLHPASFELMWKGRTFQLFFVWLIALELILSWENIQPNKIAKRALHLYCGPLYSIAWIVAYPLIILCKPEPMAQNHQQSERQKAFSCSEGNSHLTQNSSAQPTTPQPAQPNPA